MGLRLASRSVRRIELSDGAWVDVTSDINKRDFLRIITSLPESAVAESDGDGKAKINISDAMEFQTLLFDVLVQNWSLDVPVSTEAYLDLARESAEEVDKVLIEHFKDRVAPSKDELGKPSTSPAKRRKG